MKGGAGGVGEVVAGLWGGQGVVEEEDAVGEGVVEGVFGRVDDAGAIGVEAAEGDAEGVGEVVGGGFGVEDFGVGGERVAFGAVDGELGPVLGVAPGGGAGVEVLDGGLAVGLVEGEGLVDLRHDHRCSRHGCHWQPVDVAHQEMNPWVQRRKDSFSGRGVHQTTDFAQSTLLWEHRCAHMTEHRTKTMHTRREPTTDKGEGYSFLEIEGLVLDCSGV